MVDTKKHHDYVFTKHDVKNGAVTMNRTRDLLITSELLYQLSYDGVKTWRSVLDSNQRSRFLSTCFLSRKVPSTNSANAPLFIIILHNDITVNNLNTIFLLILEVLQFVVCTIRHLLWYGMFFLK